MGDRGGYGCVGVSHPCMHAHTCTYTCMHMHVKHDKHAKHGCLHVGGHLQFLYMCMHVGVCVCTCVCLHRDNSILFEDSLPLNIPELI